MIEKLKLYLSNMKACLAYYFCSAGIIFLININGEKSLVNKEISIDKIKLLINILYKNTFCFLWILAGILFGQLLIKSFLIVNGVVMGMLLSKLISISQLLIIVPHGIFEIGALILTCCIVTEIIKQKSIGKYEKIYLLISYILIIQAALIEAFITTSLIKYL